MTAELTTIEHQLRTTVAFMRVSYTDGNQTKSVEGTAFFVWYPDKRLGADGGFVYLISNRHMAAPGTERGSPHAATAVTLRLNLKGSDANAQSEEATAQLDGEHHWFFPEDAGVDLAVLPVMPDQKRYAYQAIPTDLFATRDMFPRLRISEGDPLLFTGYFVRVPGQRKWQPIVRGGTLAMMPDEPVTTVLGGQGNLYLADAHVTKGNSGSPIFVKVGGFKGNAVISEGAPYRLIGVVSGFYFEDSDFNLSVSSAVEGAIHGNSGIALVVPVDELRKLLESHPLQSERDRQVPPVK